MEFQDFHHISTNLFMYWLLQESSRPFFHIIGEASVSGSLSVVQERARWRGGGEKGESFWESIANSLIAMCIWLGDGRLIGARVIMYNMYK